MKSIRMIAPCLLAILPMVAEAEVPTIPGGTQTAPVVPMAKAEPGRPLVAATSARKIAHPVLRKLHAVSLPIRRVAVANRQATAEPAAQAFINANQVYSWSEGSVYQG